MRIIFVFLCPLLAICRGFLLNNTVVSGGTVGGMLPMTDHHYYMLTDLLALERQSREKLEQSLQQMETFVLQLHRDLLSTKDRLNILESSNGAVQGRIVNNLKNDTHFLSETVLQMKVDQDTQKKTIEGLQTDNQLLQEENLVLKDQVNICKNLTMNVKTELDLFSHSVSTSEINNATMLQNNMLLFKQDLETVKSKISQLSSNVMSLGKDFLALINQSNNADQKLINLSSEFELLKTDTKHQQLALVRKDNSTDLRITDAIRQIAAINEPVVLTSCASQIHTYSADEVILFSSTKTAYGVSNLTTFQNSGKFVCEKSGIYLFSVFIMSYSHSAHYSMLKNKDLLSWVYIVGKPKDDGDYHTGTGTLAVQLERGDTLYVIANDPMVVFHGDYSCLTITKLK